LKILIPTNEENKNEGICVSFGRAPYFMVIDTESNKEIFFTNPGAESAGGAGIKAAQAVVDTKVDALLTPRIGKNAADVITAGGIKTYKSISDSVSENTKLYNDKKLEVLTDIHPGFHGNGE
jgi:predicted Fe-Mo cluster-binding NifX family protein